MHKKMGIRVGTKSTTMTRKGRLATSAMFGLTLAVVAMADRPWPLIIGAVFILFMLLKGLRRQRNGSHEERLPPAPGAGLLGVTFGAAALVIHGTAGALWAGPALGVAAFASTYAYLRRLGNSPGGG